MSDEERRKKLRAMRDADIDYSDIAELGDDFWKQAKVIMPPEKSPISLRVDRDVLEWFKRQGRGYQSRMNAILRSYYEAHRPPDA
ncbi:MAG: BrnA antitoxin family protein [Alphaproteobacteria bacterium]|nr:BrnA antitoxin family protein [Alphaproteobacteria bacterium]